MRREGGRFSGLCYYAHRSGKFKLIQNSPFEEMQLFDIKEDPLEQNPLDKGTKEFQEMVNTLTQYIRMSGAIKWQK
jgi:hypothetical protein